MKSKQIGPNNPKKFEKDGTGNNDDREIDRFDG